jgi:hypothetical protein
METNNCEINILINSEYEDKHVIWSNICNLSSRPTSYVNKFFWLYKSDYKELPFSCIKTNELFDSGLDVFREDEVWIMVD